MYMYTSHYKTESNGKSRGLKVEMSHVEAVHILYKMHLKAAYSSTKGMQFNLL